MYGFEDYFDLNKEHILQKVSQKDIFKIVFGRELDLTERYISPFREKDKSPGCFFEEYEGKLYFKDFADKTTHRDCIDALMEFKNLSYIEALKFICKHYNLSTDSSDYKEVEEVYKEKNNYQSKELLKIDFKIRDFSKNDKRYWSQYLIYPEQLLEDSVHPISSFKIQGKNNNFYCYGLSYVYTNFSIEGAIKIYSPYSSTHKWISNTHQDCIGNWNNVNTTIPTLILSKSYKDCRVLRNLGYKNVIWLHSEKTIPSDRIILDWVFKFKKIIIFYDNDSTGLKGGEILKDVINSFKPDCAVQISLPLTTLCKDPSDLIKKEGRSDTIKILEKIGLFL